MNDNNTAVKRAPAAAADTIDLLELFYVLLNRLPILILSLIIGVTAAGLGTHYLITPQYQASSIIYIYTKTTTVTSLTDLQIGTQLASDFQLIATTREVVEPVIEELNLDMSYSQMVDNISVTNPNDTRMLQITVTNPDPQLAADISNAMSESLRTRIADVMNTDKPSVVQPAVVPTAPSSPNLLRNAAMGGLALLVLAAAIIIIRYLMDDTIQSEEDVERYLGLNTVAAIPLERLEKGANKPKKKKGHSGHSHHSHSSRSSSASASAASSASQNTANSGKRVQR